MAKFRVIHHWDVWGNEEDGWEVNDSSKAGEIECEGGPKEVWNTLVNEGIAKGNFEEAEFSIHSAGYYISEARTNRPVFNLETEDW